MHSSNILNFHSKHIQVLRIECDASMATEQTTENTRASGLQEALQVPIYQRVIL